MSTTGYILFRALKAAWRQIVTERKLKNRGCIPKTVFPTLLAKTLNTIENCIPANIQAGFRAAGISPLNRYEVLKHLPSGEPSNLQEDNAFIESFSTIINNSQLNESAPATKRKKKIDVAPGKSVSIRNLEIPMLRQTEEPEDESLQSSKESDD